MNTNRPHQELDQKARHRVIRDQFQRERPSLEELLETGDYSEPVPLGEYLTLRQALVQLKKHREKHGLSLSEVATRSGIDKAALSRLENGRQTNPTVDTLYRYAEAVGAQLAWQVLPRAGSNL